MADLITTVSSPLGPIQGLHGRVPRQKAIRETAAKLREEIATAQRHLDEIENWTVSASRGATKALTFEEYEEQQGRNGGNHG